MGHLKYRKSVGVGVLIKERESNNVALMVIFLQRPRVSVEKVKRFYRKESKRRYSSLMWISLE
jgi:hypothetical protein